MNAINLYCINSFEFVIEKLGGRRFYIVVDCKVSELHQSEIDYFLEQPTCLGNFVINASESNKSLEMCSCILNDMLDYNVQRSDCLIAIGGGITTDIGGFVASIYKRGIEWYAIPTTLLGMVDAAVGGKTGVNSEHVKNTFGSFHFPLATFYWHDFLSTLSQNEQMSGFGECLKYAYISDAFELTKVLALGDYGISSNLIMQFAAYKKSIVIKDPTENNIRKHLNFGHTLGHVIEKTTYGNVITHGVAVMYGMAFSLFVSVQKMGLNQTVLDDYLAWLIAQPFFDFAAYPKTASELISIKNDKKNCGDTIAVIVIESVGSPHINLLSFEEFNTYYESFLQTINNLWSI